MVPCFAASGDDFVVCFIGPVGEGILSGILPDIFLRAQLRAMGGQAKKADVVRGFEGFSGVPSRSVNDDDGMRPHPRLIDACWPLLPEMGRNTRVIWGNFKRMSGL